LKFSDFAISWKFGKFGKFGKFAVITFVLGRRHLLPGARLLSTQVQKLVAPR
jgi:hypothetical protein